MAEEPINMVGKPAPKSIDYNSLKYIASYGVGVGGNRRLHGERLIAPPPSAGTGEPRLRLSSEEVVRVVGARYIRFATEQEDDDWHRALSAHHGGDVGLSLLRNT